MPGMEPRWSQRLWDGILGIFHMLLCCFEGTGDDRSHDVPLSARSDEMHSAGSPSAAGPLHGDAREEESLLNKGTRHQSSSAATGGASTSGSLDVRSRPPAAGHKQQGAGARKPQDSAQTAEDLRFTKMLKPTFSQQKLRHTASFQVMVDEDVCPICLEDYSDSNPKSFLSCSHALHLSCALEWEEHGHNTCPLCDVQVASSLGD